MGIFRKHEIDLTDEGLAMAAVTDDENMTVAEPVSSQDQWEDEASAPKEPAYDEQQKQENIGAQIPAFDPIEAAEREAKWRKAANAVCAAWPQAVGQGKALISKMNEIGARYGDPLLWQRAPEGMMREAAIELFGLPKTKDNTYAKIAAEAARANALREIERRDHAKIGLSKKKGGSSPAAMPSEEEKIIAAIAKAKDHSIF